jgi:hypothetical protein
MAGNTTTIDVQAFKADYAENLTHYELAERHTITRDQLIRLVRVWGLPLRHDRKARKKPRGDWPTCTHEIYSVRCLEIQRKWTAEIREERSVVKTRPVEVSEAFFVEDSDDE